MAKKNKPRRRPRRTTIPSGKRLSANNTHKLQLYQWSVQSPELEANLLDELYEKNFSCRAETMREDFSGTALISAWWSQKWQRLACAVDLCGETQGWGYKNNRSAISYDRVLLVEGDVLTFETTDTHIIHALNYSYCVFKERSVFREYLQKCFQRLDPQRGMLVLDLYGGVDYVDTDGEARRIAQGFTYHWDQRSYNALTQEVVKTISFSFTDGTVMSDAFEYDWRIWSVTEIRDLMEEVGFQVRFYQTASSESDDLLEEVKHVDSPTGWDVYIVGLKK